MTAFQLKDFASISAASINQMKASQDRITDFRVGSGARTLLEGPAIEIEELYQRFLAGVLDAIPTSIYKAFDFALVGAAAARGTVHVTFTETVLEPFTIPAGTVFVANGTTIKYTSVSDLAVPAGAAGVDVVVVCATTGSAGNVGANAITATDGFTFPASFTLANDAFTSGTDGQTDAERKALFVQFLRSLARGTVDSILYAVNESQIFNASGQLVEYVSRSGKAEVPGLISVYIYGSSGVPSADLLALAQRTVDGYVDASGSRVAGYVAAGVEARVLAMTERLVDVSLHVNLGTGQPGTDALKNQIATALAGQFDSVQSDQTLTVAQLRNAVLELPGIVKVTADNNANVVCGGSEVLKLGTLTVEWNNA